MKILGRTFGLVSITVISVGILCDLQPASADSYVFTSFRYPGTNISGASGINSSGQVVGFGAEPPGISADPVGFLYFAGIFTPILFPGSTSTYATGINNSGVVIGNSSAGAFIESGGTYKLFGSPGSANGINNFGQIVGSAGTQGYFYDGSLFQTIDVPGSTSTVAQGINNAGKIVGSYSLGGKNYGFLDDGGIFSSISVPGAQSTFALGINNLGEIVGYFTDQHGYHGFVRIGEVFHTFDVPDAISLPEASVTIAAGINDDGVMTGSWASDVAGKEYAFVATPVPEPSTLGLVGTGLFVLATSVRRNGFTEVMGSKASQVPLLAAGYGPAMDRGFCRQDTHQPKLFVSRPTDRYRGEVDQGESQARPEDGR